MESTPKSNESLKDEDTQKMILFIAPQDCTPDKFAEELQKFCREARAKYLAEQAAAKKP